MPHSPAGVAALDPPQPPLLLLFLNASSSASPSPPSSSSPSSFSSPSSSSPSSSPSPSSSSPSSFSPPSSSSSPPSSSPSPSSSSSSPPSSSPSPSSSASPSSSSPRPSPPAAALSPPPPAGGGPPEPSPGGAALPPPAPPAPASPPPGAVNPWDVALCATGTVVAGENALVLVVLCTAPALCGPTFLLLGSLALADLLAGLGLLADFAARHLVRPPSEAAELGAAGLLLAAFSASACSLLAITVDRYLSLSSALTYPAERTRPFTCALLALLWTLCATGGLLPALGWHCLRAPAACSVLRPVTRDHAAVLAVAFLLLLGLMLQLDLHICRIALRHAQQIAGQRPRSPGAAPARRGVSTLSLVLGLFAACWTPLAVYALVADASSPPVYTYCLALPAACHSAINPLVYAFRDPDVQKSLGLALGGRGAGCGAGPCCPPGSLSPPARTSGDV